MKSIHRAACLLLVVAGLSVASAEGADQANQTITWHIMAEVDGSDRVIVSEQETLWVHRHWAWPARVTINDTLWHPQHSPALPEKAHRKLLAAPVDFASARMTIHQGRDTAVLQTFDDHIVIHLVDSPNGAAPYELTVTFDLRDERPRRSSRHASQHRHSEK